MVAIDYIALAGSRSAVTSHVQMRSLGRGAGRPRLDHVTGCCTISRARANIDGLANAHQSHTNDHTPPRAVPTRLIHGRLHHGHARGATPCLRSRDPFYTVVRTRTHAHAREGFGEELFVREPSPKCKGRGAKLPPKDYIVYTMVLPKTKI